MASGIKIKDEIVGAGPVAEKGGLVTIRYNLALNGGERIQTEERSTFVIGKRTVIAGLELGVVGMRVGGRRTIRVSPHLAYRDKGVPGCIPPHAVLVFEVELLSVE